MFKSIQQLLIFGFLTISHHGLSDISERIVRDINKHCLEKNSGACDGRYWRNLQEAIQNSSSSYLAVKKQKSWLPFNKALEEYMLANKLIQGSFDEINRKYNILQGYFNVQQGFSFFSATVPNLNYHPIEMLEVQNVIEHYGHLELDVDQIFSRSEPIIYKAKTIPWSGPWLPTSKKTLYASENAPLAKLDRIAAAQGKQINSSNEEQRLSEILGQDSWEGHCHAWALASIIEPEPKNSIELHGETLTSGDQKAIYAKLYDRVGNPTYGHRYIGDSISDGAYQDIRPEAFHKVMLTFLKEIQSAFIIDKSPGHEVWQFPVFKAKISLSPDLFEPDAIAVETHVWLTKPRENLDSRSTGIADQMVKTYNYRLFIDPIPLANGNYRVIAGDWTGASINDHPDFIVIPSKKTPKSSNRAIDSHLNFIMKILKKDL